MAKKADHHAKVLAAIQGRLGKGSSRMAREGSSSDVRVVVPTGIEVLDHWILGCGGLPCGRMGEIYSEPGTGKTSLGFQLLAAVQKQDGISVYIETENALESSRMDAFDVDRDKLILAEPNTIEETVDAMHDIVKTLPADNSPKIIVWDSLAGTELEAQAQAKTFAQTKTVGKRGKLMSEALPVICRLAMQKTCAVVIINQTRQKIGVMFGNPTTTPGGNAAKFQTSWRLGMWRGSAIKQGTPTEETGRYVTIKATKNKLAIPQRKAKVRFFYEDGWDNDWALVELAKERKLIAQKARPTPKRVKEAREALGFPALPEDTTESE